MTHLIHAASGAWIVPPAPEVLLRQELAELKAELSEVKDLLNTVLSRLPQE